MKALSIKQPFCDLILINQKKYEIRPWKTKYRGKLLICSTKIPINNKYLNLINGYTICIVDLIDIIPFTRDMEKLAFVNYSPRLWAWILANPISIKQFKIKGQMGLFELPTYLKDAVNLLQL